MSKLRIDPDDDAHAMEAINGLKKLVRQALKEKRSNFVKDAKALISRRQSLQAIFKLKK